MDNKKQLTIENLQRAKAIMNRTDAMPRNANTLNGGNSNNLDVVQPATPQYIPKPPSQKNKVTESASKLPKEILQSFMDKPLKEADRDISFLTEGIPTTPPVMGNDMEYGEKPMPDMNEMLKSKIQQRQQAGTPPQMNIPPRMGETPAIQTNPSSPIDYSLIKMIIKEVVKEEFDNLVKNEGVAILKLDKKLNVITNSGNVFTGALKKAGNIKKGG